MIYGYCSSMSGKRELRQQQNNILEAYPEAQMIRDIITQSGSAEYLLAVVSSTDTLVLDNIARISKDADMCYDIYTMLYNAGRNLVFLKEPYLNTSTYREILSEVNQRANRQELTEAVFIILKEQIRVSIEYFEQEAKKRSTNRKNGIEKARLEGKQIGQKKGAKLHIKKKAAIKEGIRANAREFGGSMTDAECMIFLHVAYKTYYKYKHEIREEITETHTKEQDD